MQSHDASCDCGRCRVERRNRGTQALGIKIALHGGIFRKGVYVATWEPYCEEPLTLDRYITSRQAVDNLKAMEVSMKVPCRKCPKCLQFRQMKWAERALSEILQANRTWFVTLTFNAIHLAGILSESKGNDLKQIEFAAYRHIQRFVKRLRKQKCVFRYLAVYERGEKSGRSHYHLFLHETGDRPVLKETLERQWISFVHARLVRSDEAYRKASYLTKYTTKSIEIRPRASVGYGNIR